MGSIDAKPQTGEEPQSQQAAPRSRGKGALITIAILLIVYPLSLGLRSSASFASQ